MVHFDHIFCLQNKFKLLQILVLCTVVNFVHYYKFQLLHVFFHVIIDQFEFFLSVGKIIAVFCKITCRIWILNYVMSQAILFLSFIYFLKKDFKEFFKKKNFFFFFFFFIFLQILQNPKNLIYREGSGRSDLDHQIQHEKIQL